MKHVVVLVSNDVVFDQRIQKTASTLEQLGYRVSFVGRKHANSPPLPEGMKGRRYRLPFRTGPGFYGALQAAFVADVLTRRRFDVVWANDLDTLFPARIAGWLRRVPVVFDSHEFFTEHAGLAERPRVQGFWRWWERRLMPGLKAVITVNDAIADAFVDRFPGASFGRPLVVRNMPPLRAEMPRCDRSVFAPYGIPTDRPIALLQGAYLDRDRGVLDAVNLLEAMEDVRLVLVGAGEEWDAASALAARGVGGGRLHCLPRLPFAAHSIILQPIPWPPRPRGLRHRLFLGHGEGLLATPGRLYDGRRLHRRPNAESGPSCIAPHRRASLHACAALS